MSVGSFALLVCWPFARPHFCQFRFRHQRNVRHVRHTNPYIYIYIHFECFEAISNWRSIVSSTVLFDVWHRLKVEPFDALNTFDVNLIIESLTERTNFGQTKTIANLLLKLTTSCDIGFQHTVPLAAVAHARILSPRMYKITLLLLVLLLLLARSSLPGIRHRCSNSAFVCVCSIRDLMEIFINISGNHRAMDSKMLSWRGNLSILRFSIALKCHTDIHDHRLYLCKCIYRLWLTTNKNR